MTDKFQHNDCIMAIMNSKCGKHMTKYKAISSHKSYIKTKPRL